MSNIFFTADTHFSHPNIIKYCERPFSSVEEMDETLIINWNSRIRPGDIVYHLGDFAFQRDLQKYKNLVKSLNGQIQLIKGNHDRFNNKEYINLGFTWVGDYKKVKIFDKEIVLCHYAMRTWDKSHHGSWMFFGHTHGNLQSIFSLNVIIKDHHGEQLKFFNIEELLGIAGKTMDVGVDTNNYFPYSFEEIQEKLK